MKVFVLPGLDGTGEMVADFEAQLKATRDVHVFTYPTSAMLNYAELTGLVLKNLPRDGPYCIIAESFSGPIATRIAATNPTGLCAVVFAASFVKKPSFLPKAAARFAGIIPANSSSFLRLAQPFTFGRWKSNGLHQLLVRSVNAISSKVLAFRIREVMGVDELIRFANITVPMLYLRPTQDRLVSRKAAEVMSSVNPALDVTEVEGPHFILQVKPEACAKIVIDFLDSVPGE